MTSRGGQRIAPNELSGGGTDGAVPRFHVWRRRRAPVPRLAPPPGHGSRLAPPPGHGSRLAPPPGPGSRLAPPPCPGSTSGAAAGPARPNSFPDSRQSDIGPSGPGSSCRIHTKPAWGKSRGPAVGDFGFAGLDSAPIRRRRGPGPTLFGRPGTISGASPVGRLAACRPGVNLETLPARARGLARRRGRARGGGAARPGPRRRRARGAAPRPRPGPTPLPRATP